MESPDALVQIVDIVTTNVQSRVVIYVVISEIILSSFIDMGRICNQTNTKMSTTQFFCYVYNISFTGGVQFRILCYAHCDIFQGISGHFIHSPRDIELNPV